MVSRSKFLKMSTEQQIYKISDCVRIYENNIASGKNIDLAILKKYIEFLKEEKIIIPEIKNTIKIVEKTLQNITSNISNQNIIKSLNFCFHELIGLLNKSIKEENFIDHKIKIFDTKKDKKTFDIVMILDNIRSPFNVGSMFRSSDCLGIKELVLCGITPHPPSLKIEKTSMQTVNFVNWKYLEKTSEAIKLYKNEGYKIYALETIENSTLLYELEHFEKIAFIFGNEEFGITHDIIQLCDGIIEIPLMGIKNSMNVSNAFAIVSYDIMCKNILKRNNF